MKNLAGTLLLVLLAAAGTGFIAFRMTEDTRLHAAAASGDAMAWLGADFNLNADQFAAIRRLHEGYAGSCEEHCRMIREATQVRNELAAAHGDPAAVTAANARVEELRQVCETAITRHVRQVAAIMSPADGERYLALVLPKITDFDHQAAPDLRLNHAH